MQEKAAKPARMVRKQILITGEQNRRLKSLAAALAKPEGELVRAALEDWLARQKSEDEDWKAAWRQAFGMWKDRDDLGEFYAERRKRRRERRERINKLMSDKSR